MHFGAWLSRLCRGLWTHSLSPILILAPATIAFGLILDEFEGQNHGGSLAQYAKDDVRLQQRITLCMPQAYLGEVLERLSETTGVAIVASRHDGTADQQILIAIQDTSLTDVLESIWSLVSYRTANFEWKRHKDGSAYTYELSRPLKSKSLPSRLKREIQERFEAEADILLRASQMDPEKRAAYIEDASLKGYEDRELRRRLMSNRRRWGGLSVLAESLPASPRLSILRGDDQLVRIPVGRMTDKGRSFVHSEWESAKAVRRSPDGTSSPVPEPDHITVDAHRFSADHLSPSLFIYINGSGYPYVGGKPLDDVAEQRMMELWILPGDSTTSKLEDIQIQKSPLAIPEGLSIRKGRLLQLATSSGVSTFVRLPPDYVSQSGSDPGSPIGLNIREYLELAKSFYRVQHKWRGNNLLISSPSWIYYDDNQIPWARVKTLRTAGVRENGFVDFDSVLKLVGALNKDQLLNLGHEFSFVRLIVSWYPVLHKLATTKLAYNAVKSSRGLPLDQILPEMSQMRGLPMSSYVSSGARWVNLEIEDAAGNRKAVFRLRDNAGKVISSPSLVFGRSKAASEQPSESDQRTSPLTKSRSGHPDRRLGL